MPGTEKTKASTQAEEPATVTGSSKQENAATADSGPHTGAAAEVEIGGSKGLEPTRYGDWEKNGRCTDF
ncbi:MAG: succinate dehydrogenase assembly factor 4 [Xanthomonadales bacterium]